MATIQDILTQPNIQVDRSWLKPGSNTTVNTNISPTNWVPWSEFTYENLTRIFHKELSSKYTGPKGRDIPLPQDQVLFHEDTLEDFLRRFIIPDVNYCLDQSECKPHFGRGSRCGGYEDWSVVSPSWTYEGQLINCLPGDTKISSKWWPTMLYDGSPVIEWEKPVAQEETYMVENYTRYGFIITDDCLVVMRATRKPIGPGLAADRPRRQAATFVAGHQRQFSDVSMASGSTSGQESSFQDDDPMNWDYYDPEYAIIPWSNYGETLTIKSSLWFLAMMAVKGDRFIDYSYPALDSWRKGSDGKYIHNTTGATKAVLASGDLYQERDPQQAEREKELKGNIASVSEGVARMEIVSEDIPTSNPAGGTSGDTSGDKGKQAAGDQSDKTREEGDNGGNSDGDDDKTEIGASKGGSYYPTSIRKQGFPRGLQYKDYRGAWRDTQKGNWKKVNGGYILRGKHHTYFVTNFPR
ncbi:hypothetical protein F5Y10DRAFT_254571 [Nemania abortiva]|nr:hypothetical protein F5Y10DRAFT_254571 [Nemania abortiva]